MTISAKGRRRLVVEGRVFVWYVAHDPDGAGPTLTVASADRRVLLKYFLLQSESDRHVVVLGSQFRGIPDCGGRWRRFRCPEFGSTESIGPGDVRALLDWATQPTGIAEEVDWRGQPIVNAHAVRRRLQLAVGMTGKDWFRKTRWTEADQSDFEARLKRARALSRPQYLYIQAFTLYELRDTKLLGTCIALLDRCLGEFPPHVHVAPALHLRGRCLDGLADAAGALAAYRAALDVERQGKSILTDAYLDFAWVVAVGGHRELFHQAVELLDEFADRLAFPVQSFRWHAARALIAECQADHSRASSEARLALASAKAQQSGFAFHQSLGLVEDSFLDVRERLRVLSDQRER
jgi:hypothetical protein